MTHTACHVIVRGVRWSWKFDMTVTGCRLHFVHPGRSELRGYCRVLAPLLAPRVFPFGPRRTRNSIIIAMGRDRKSDEQRRARHAAFMRRWRAKQRLGRLVRKPKAKRDGNGPVSIKANHIQELHASRLREFQEWYRHRAAPEHREVRHQPEMIRARRLPNTSAAAWLAALVCFWWLDAFARDAVGWLLTDEEPDWQLIRRLLGIAQRVPKRSDQDTRRRRGWGAVPSGSSSATRPFLTVHRWHNLLLHGGVPNIVAAVHHSMRPTTTRSPGPKLTTMEAATALSGIRGIGPYLAKNVLDTLLLEHVVVFDKGVVGPGALASARYLCGGNLSLSAPGVWPAEPSGEQVRDVIGTLAKVEGCHWIDMQSALCLWRRQHVGGV